VRVQQSLRRVSQTAWENTKNLILKVRIRIPLIRVRGSDALRDPKTHFGCNNVGAPEAPFLERAQRIRYALEVGSRRGEEEFRVRLEKLPAFGVDDDFQRQEKAA
jgi:hypothetical protein